MRGTLFVIATPIGNLEDLTFRALRVLREVSLIAAEDTRRTAKLLNHYEIRTRSTSLHEHNERVKSLAILARLESGEDVALVSDAGTPGVSDPGAALIAAARTAGFAVVPIPGPSAVLAALVASGHATDTFTFVGFPPIRSKDRKHWVARLESDERTVVFFEAPHRVVKTLWEIRTVLGNRQITAARELTKVHEEWLTGPIEDVIAKIGEPRGEFTFVLPAVAAQETIEKEPLSDEEILRQFGQLTENDRLERRAAIAALASRHGIPQRQVYAAVERARKLAHP